MVEENPVEYVAQELIDFSTHVLCETGEVDFPPSRLLRRLPDARPRSRPRIPTSSRRSPAP